MKRITIVVLMLLSFAAAAYGQETQEKKAQPAAPQAGQQQMQMCPKMGAMGGQGMQGGMMGMQGMKGMKCRCMMMQDIVPMMKEVMGIQQKLIAGASDTEKKKMSDDLARMISQIDSMSTGMGGMGMCGMMNMQHGSPAGQDDPAKAGEKKMQEHKH
ncbi:MAG TPA: hypothetical protein VN260_04955 [Dissulfurispiraceae bacterium]|nr:hypothetical protein [Dissulfurispiraceae bacterium]